MRVSFRENTPSPQQPCQGAAGTGVFSVCSAGAEGWAAGTEMLSLLDFFALKAKASYMRVHGQKRGKAAKKAVCYNRHSVLKLLSRGRWGIFKIRRGAPPRMETDTGARPVWS